MSEVLQENGHYFATHPLSEIELERGERLLYRLTEFGHILWESGIDVGPRKILDLSETLNYIDITKSGRGDGCRSRAYSAWPYSRL